MLAQLSGKAHLVITACAVSIPGATPHVFYDQAVVRFANWPPETLRAYANTGEPLDKAGAYAVQGQGAFLIESIEGAWTTVMGLPVPRLCWYLLNKGCISSANSLP
jgi:septum formation protein